MIPKSREEQTNARKKRQGEAARYRQIQHAAGTVSVLGLEKSNRALLVVARS
jgi:hypothetical protein